jgi:micrococcal nuclease
VTCDWANVVKVTDGDTIRVDFVEGEKNRPIRYIGIDTPETVHPTLGVQPFGPEASTRNKSLVGSKRVCLEPDVSETDRYDRLLRYVWLADGRMVNEVLVQEGLAVLDTFPPDVKYADRFLAAQALARDSGLGVWTIEQD